MGFNCGIVGLPNVGKSTLFNALTQTAAAATSNYPFCTIEPNVGRVAVPDPRLRQIADHGKSPVIIPTQIEFTDIAGLVRGASRGEGLGNQFLGHIREVTAIVHVLRCFEDENVAHVEDRIDPVSDAATVETELMLADLDSIERRLVPIEKRYRGGDKTLRRQFELMGRVAEVLREGQPARVVQRSREEERPFRELLLLTAKPVLYAANVGEAEAARGNAHSDAVAAMAEAQGAGTIVISGQIEAELAQLDEAEEREAFLTDLGLREAGLDRLIRAGYTLLDLITYFTAGPKEAHAWTIPRGTIARAAAGVIHTDFERGFIAGETISADDYIARGGEQAARDAGCMRLEGADYAVQDGDVILFRFNV